MNSTEKERIESRAAELANDMDCELESISFETKQVFYRGIDWEHAKVIEDELKKIHTKWLVGIMEQRD